MTLTVYDTLLNLIVHFIPTHCILIYSNYGSYTHICYVLLKMTQKVRHLTADTQLTVHTLSNYPTMTCQIWITFFYTPCTGFLYI